MYKLVTVFSKKIWQYISKTVQVGSTSLSFTAGTFDDCFCIHW